MNSRSLAGAVAGGVAGAFVFAAAVVLGLILDDRVSNIVPVIVFSIGGAYGGWLVGVVVFGRVRGIEGQENPP